ncbi:GntR family transcriptional regulator [Qingshengfaniella alkalisoli]|uniref:GntR family transcriptional regulator n=1 Tax=Qingshengfaniella alkalisoli TaxID=2599296 RepID=A0A5B8IBQ6_9RHOB|nr:GntR family transcriptional regulator [Qingshengfaniella alkalisoli]QDY70896.1 GntR family transcriptional regulator [Qingshengfaniella alkalisoli]
MTEITSFLAPEAWLLPNGGPRYLQLRKRIEQGISEGLLVPESPLPAEREIAAKTNLSRVTVRKAFRELAEKGLIVQRQGSGSFVAGTQKPRMEQSLSALTSFTEDMRQRGLTVESEWIERGVFSPSPEETLSLGLSLDERVSRISRLRRADGRPLAIERASLPVELLPDPFAVETSLYAELDGRGIRPVRAIQKISAINLNAADAGLLGVAERDAGLRIERTSYLESGRVVEFTRSVYRGDTYDFVAQLRLSDG